MLSTTHRHRCADAVTTVSVLYTTHGCGCMLVSLDGFHHTQMCRWCKTVCVRTDVQHQTNWMYVILSLFYSLHRHGCAAPGQLDVSMFYTTRRCTAPDQLDVCSILSFQFFARPFFARPRMCSTRPTARPPKKVIVS
jgi:hypothetical protein